MKADEQQQWLHRRRGGLGGTDAAAVAGVHPYKSAIDVWADKLGLSEPVVENEAMAWGKRLEPVIAQCYADLTGYALSEPGLLKHPQHDFILGTPDRLVEGLDLGLEIKTANPRSSHRWGEPGTDQVPEEYHLQCDHYMAITERSAWDLAVLIGGSDFRIYHLHRDSELEAGLLELECRFWQDHILAGVPPELDGSEASQRFIASKFPRNTNPILTADREGEVLMAHVRDTRARLREAERKALAAEVALKAIIGDAAGIEHPDLGRVTWKLSRESQRLDNKALASDPAVQELVSKYTRTVPGSRRFLVPRSWTSFTDDDTTGSSTNESN